MSCFCVAGAAILINGVLLPEPYVYGAQTICLPDYECGQGQVEVLDGRVFVMGDNRGNNSDSREYGLVWFSEIKGRVRQGAGVNR
jgi:signal peptidase I